MRRYTNAALLKYKHIEPRKPQHSPYLWDKPQYGQTTQYAKPVDNSPKLDANGIKHIQKFIGTSLYYAHAIDSTIVIPINAISVSPANGTTSTAANVS